MRCEEFVKDSVYVAYLQEIRDDEVNLIWLMPTIADKEEVDH